MPRFDYNRLSRIESQSKKNRTLLVGGGGADGNVKGVVSTKDGYVPSADGTADELITYEANPPHIGATGEFSTYKSPVYDVTHPDWGVTGDGSTDDSTAIQAVIDQCDTDGGGVVFFPAGIYKCDTKLTLKEQVSMLGSGPGSKIRAGTSGMTLVDCQGSTSARVHSVRQIFLQGNDLADIILYTELAVQLIEDVWIQDAKPGTGYGLVMDAAQNCCLHKVLIDKCYIGAHFSSGARNILWNKGVVTDCEQYNIQIEYDGQAHELDSTVATSAFLCFQQVQTEGDRSGTGPLENIRVVDGFGHSFIDCTAVGTVDTAGSICVNIDASTADGGDPVNGVNWIGGTVKPLATNKKGFVITDAVGVTISDVTVQGRTDRWLTSNSRVFVSNPHAESNVVGADFEGDRTESGSGQANQAIVEYMDGTYHQILGGSDIEVATIVDEDYADLGTAPSYCTFRVLQRASGDVLYMSMSSDGGSTWAWQVIASPFGRPPA